MSTATARVPIELGPFELRPGARYERHDMTPDGAFAGGAAPMSTAVARAAAKVLFMIPILCEGS